MKRIIPASLFFLCSLTASGQADVSDTLSLYFEEIKTATAANQGLWGLALYGPMLLVDPATRAVYANEPDPAGTLVKQGSSYTGSLPVAMSIANTALEWKEKYWAMIMLPLPRDKRSRINLLAHELFHRAQPALGFVPRHASNYHLDQKDGRVYLRLELEALRKALRASREAEIKQYLTHAFAFRKYRHQTYPGADTSENILELNEGLAEFTGVIVSERDRQQYEAHFEESIDGFLKNPTFVRSFAYETTPAYGYLLYTRKKDWPRDISGDTNLTRYFMDAFAIELPDLESSLDLMMEHYDTQTIIAEETAREKRVKKLLGEYRQRLVEAPHFDIVVEELKGVSFDPRTLIPMGDTAVIFPEIRIVDKWGILTVHDGAIITPPWEKITISVPTEIKDNSLSGDSWVLELSEGYTVSADKESGNYTLTKE